MTKHELFTYLYGDHNHVLARRKYHDKNFELCLRPGDVWEESDFDKFNLDRPKEDGNN